MSPSDVREENERLKRLVDRLEKELHDARVELATSKRADAWSDLRQAYREKRPGLRLVATSELQGERK